MADNCNIVRNNRGQVVSTEAPNGSRSILFDSLLNKLQEPAEALKVWLVSKTKDFTEGVMNPLKAKTRRQLAEKVKANTSINSNFSLIKTPKLKTINLNIDGNKVGRIRFKETAPKSLVVDSSLIDADKKGKGLGTQLYLGLFQYALRTNSKVNSSTTLSAESKGVWDKLVRLGLAEEDTSGVYKFNYKVEGLDENGEPKMGTLLNYIDNASINKGKVAVTDSDSSNPSFEKGSMVDITMEGGRLEIGKVKGAKFNSILSLYVDEESRRQGVASNLIKKALEITDNKLSGQASNDAAVALNYKLGMRLKGGEGLTLEESLEKRRERGEDGSIPMISTEKSKQTPTKNKEITLESSDLKNIMMGMRVKSSTELVEKLKQGFMPEGYFNPNRISLNSINLYNGEEITDILTSTDLQENIREFIYKLNNLNKEVLNDIYTDENFLVVKDGTKNGIGKFKLANPYVMEKYAIETLGGISTRLEFEDALFNDDLVSPLVAPYLDTQGTKEDLFKRFKAFRKIAEINLIDKNIVAKQSPTREILEQVLVEPEDTSLEDNLAYLYNLEAEVYISNPEVVKKLVKQVTKDIIGIGLDVTELESRLQGKTIEEFKEFINEVYTFITTETDQAFDNLIGAYDDFFEINRDFKFKNLPIAENISSNNSFYLESGESNISLFKNNGLIPIGKNIFKRVSKATPIEELYDRVYVNTTSNGYNSILSEEAFRPSGYDSDGTLDLSKITDPENKVNIIRDIQAYIQAQTSEVYVGNEEVTQEDLERYVLMFNYFNKSNNINKFTEIPTLDNEYSVFKEDIKNKEYLQTDFIADFYKKMLREKSKDSLVFTEFFSNFAINSTGIKLINTDPISISNINKYLADNKNLVNYLKLHKQGINLDGVTVEDPIRDDLFMRNFYTNFPTAVKVFKGDYNKLSNKTLIADSKESFIRLGDGVYELISGVGNKGVYGKLYIQEGLYKAYSTSLKPPSLDIDITELSAIDANLNIQTEVSNLYSADEKTKINNEYDNC